MTGVKQAGGTARPVRQRLLEAAEELYYAHGIASVGVDAVVARAGVATASLYNNFGGKDGLVAGYLQSRDKRWRQHWEAHISKANNPCERVLAVFSALDSWEPGPNKGCAHLAAIQQLPVDHPGAVASRHHKRRVLDRFCELLTEAGCTEPEEAGADLLLIYEGTLALQATGHDSNAIRRGCRLARRQLEAASTA